MRKKHIFTIIMTLSCVLLFLQRFTGMAVHAMLGLAMLIISIVHTIRRRKVWNVYGTYQKSVGIAMWLALAVVMVTGFLLKPFTGVMSVTIVHKLSSVVFVIFLILHIRIHSSSKMS